MMRNVLTIARREFGAYFNSPVAYVVLGVYLVAVSALFFFVMGGGVFVRSARGSRCARFFAIWRPGSS